MMVAVYVTPKAGRDEVCGWREGPGDVRELSIHVSSPPEKGKATKAAAAVLAKHYGVPKSKVTCVSGATSRHKRFEVAQ